MSETTGPATNWDLDKVMAKINALIANAENEGNTEEARASYRAKAEQLMRDYRVKEESLIAEDQFSILPIVKKFDIVEGFGSPFAHYYSALWRCVSVHCGLESRVQWERQDDGKYKAVATAVGYASDLRYAEFLWASARLMFASHLEPSVDRATSDQDNVYRLRRAGMERIRIAEVMWGTRDHAANARVTRLYKAACAARGEEPTVTGRSVNAGTYREVYAKSFLDRVYGRLWEARNAADSVGGGIELKGRRERVLEKFYTVFPDARPKPPEETVTVTASKKGKEKALKPYVPSRSDMDRYNRFNHSPAALAGKAAGTRAAEAVEISRTSKRAQRVEAHQETGGTAGELEA